MFLHAFSGIFSLLIVVALGYILTARGWFSESCIKMLPRLVTNVSLPPFLACTIIVSLDRNNLLHMLYGIIIPLSVMILLFYMAWLVGRHLKVSKRHFGLFCASVSNPNTIFIGIPVNQALFGSDSLQYVLLYYFGSTLFFWTVGNWLISRDQSCEAAYQKSTAFSWRKIISAPLIGFLAGLSIMLGDVHIPEFIMRAASIIGELTTPLALIFIGIMLRKIGLENIRFSRDIILALSGRMLLSPLLMLGVTCLVPLPTLMGRVFIIQSSLPVIMQLAILSAYYKTDPNFGSIMVSASTILAVITVPVWMWLL